MVRVIAAPPVVFTTQGVHLRVPDRSATVPALKTQFKGMTLQPVTVAELEETRRALVKLIRSRLTDDQRNFLLSFKQGEPNWPLLSLTGVEQLPAAQWKLINIRRMPKARHTEAVAKSRRTLFEAIPALQ